MVTVLDASALLEGNYRGEGLVTVPEVVAEFRSEDARRKLLELELAGLEVRSPGAPSVERVNDSARRTGDEGRLSHADIQVLALALELEALLVTADFSIQNLAEVLGVRYESPSGRITRQITWRFRCRGCSRWYDERHPDCPVCGSELRQRPWEGA